MTPAEAKRKIVNMMTGRRLALRNPGPREFPKYIGQSPRDYVRAYEYRNRTGHGCTTAFHLDDLYAPVGYVVRKQGV